MQFQTSETKCYTWILLRYECRVPVYNHIIDCQHIITCDVCCNEDSPYLIVKLQSQAKQGGILAGSLGARLPRNLQTHTKFLQQFTLFWRKFDLKVHISCQMKEFFLSHTTFGEFFLVTGRDIFALHKFFIAQEEISCPRKESLIMDRNLLSQKEIALHQKIFLSHKIASCHGKEFHVTVRIFLSK